VRYCTVSCDCLQGSRSLHTEATPGVVGAGHADTERRCCNTGIAFDSDADTSRNIAGTIAVNALADDAYAMLLGQPLLLGAEHIHPHVGAASNAPGGFLVPQPLTAKEHGLGQELL